MDVVEPMKKRAVRVVVKAGEGAAGACGAAWGSPVAYQALHAYDSTCVRHWQKSVNH
jgi:hypothetical protein